MIQNQEHFINMMPKFFKPHTRKIKIIFKKLQR